MKVIFVEIIYRYVKTYEKFGQDDILQFSRWYLGRLMQDVWLRHEEAKFGKGGH